MEFEWDPAKAALNHAKHGVAFARIDAFDWDTALVLDDTRVDYAERRFVAFGLIGSRVHVCVFTERPPKRRLIGLRKANRRENRLYTEARDDDEKT